MKLIKLILQFLGRFKRQTNSPKQANKPAEPTEIYMVDFKCDHCGQVYTDYNLHLSVFLYGVAFLVGEEAEFICFTCPRCIKTILLKVKSVAPIRQILSTFYCGNRGQFQLIDLRYYSSITYNYNLIPELKNYDVVFRTIDISSGSEQEFSDYLSTNSPLSTKGYVCSYTDDKQMPIGTMATIGWFNSNQVEEFISLENEHEIRIFPRYVVKMDWYERYDFFCWRYKLYQDYLLGLKNSASESMNSLSDYAYEENINLDRLIEANSLGNNIATFECIDNQVQQMNDRGIQATSEFLDLLVNFNPSPWDLPGAMSDIYKGMWKTISPFANNDVPSSVIELDPETYKTQMSDAEVENLSDKIRSHYTKTHVQEWAAENHQKFIEEYITIASRPDFSYGHVWDLKCSYLQQLNDILGTVKFGEKKYAFLSEQNAWRIKFDGNAIGGLKGKGFRYIHYLVANQGKEADVFSLGGLDGGPKGIISEHIVIDEDEQDTFSDKDSEKADVNEVADAELKEIYENKITELELTIKDAKKMADDQLLEESESELQRLRKLYNEDFWKGKSRKFDDGTLKTRKAITKAIARAINEIEGQKPIDQNKFRTRVASHFRNALKPISIYKISYTPKDKIDWMLS